MSKSITKKTRLLKPSVKRWTPHGYQKKAVKFLLEHQAAALLLDPGLGKTSCVLGAFKVLKKKGLARKMLVVAPLRPCYLVWPVEVAEWDDFKDLRVVVLHGKHKEALLQEEADIYVINPEGLDWLMKNPREFKKLGFDTLVLDELTRWKKSTGKRFKLLKKCLDYFQRRWGLTGTPAPNGLLDLFGQMLVLDLGRSLGQYITHYRSMYFRNPDGNGWKWVPQAGAPELIYERLKPLCLRMEAKDYLELPQRVDLQIFVDLPPKLVDLYDQLEEDLVAKIDQKLVVAKNSASASVKLRQLCNGAIYIDDDMASMVRGRKRAVQEFHDLKLDAVEELVDELNGQPLLLAYEFNHDLDRIVKRFPKVPIIQGKSMKEMKRIEDAWNAGDIPLLPGQPASIGHGLNMQKGNAAHVGWFANFWDLELYDQFLRRVLRQGNQAKRVFNHHFIARRDNAYTVDQLIYTAQRRKERGQQALSDALKDLRAIARARLARRK